MMDIPSTLQQARDWLGQGLLEEAEELLFSLRRQFESEPGDPHQMLEMWRGALAVAQARRDIRTTHDVVPRMIQAGRQVFEFDSEPMGQLMHQAGLALACVGSGADSEMFFQQALRRLGDDPVRRYGYARGLTNFYACYGHYEVALSWARQAVTLSTQPAEQVQAQRAVALLMDLLGKGLEALALRQQAMTQDPSSRAWLLVDQARGQRRLGWASKAETYYLEALELLPGEEKPRMYRELALARLSRRDLAGAEEALQQGKAVCEATTFEHHLLRAEQARLWQFQGRFAESQAALGEVLASWGERFQPHHPLCLRLREVEVEQLILRRDFVVARERAREMLVLASGAFGCEHPSVARALYWMAQTFMYEGERQAAHQVLRQANKIWQDFGDVDDIEWAQIGFGMGLMQADDLEFYKAEDEIRQACDMVERSLGTESSALGHFFNGLSDVHRVTGRERQAQEMAQKAQELLRPRR